MTYSYEQQIERLLDFVEDVYRHSDNEYFKRTAKALLNDEPVKRGVAIFGSLESPRNRSESA